jgi:hypothetical protein
MLATCLGPYVPRVNYPDTGSHAPAFDGYKPILSENRC